MTDEAETTSGALVEQAISGAIDAVAGANIPEPIKKNFFKAFGQLCTAAVEIPAAYMEGVAAERRAETQARVKLIEKSANEISEQMQFDPEYARAAVKKFGQRVVREQINLDRITEKAAESLTHFAEATPEQPEVPQAPISDDWLNVFEREAGQKSTEEMQAMFAKVLAGEIQKPSAYSIKSVRLLGSLDQRTANLFKRFCSMCIALQMHDHVIDARVPSLGSNAASNGLRKFGLTFDSLNHLQEYGLIISDYNSWMDYSPSFGSAEQPVVIPFTFGHEKWGLVKTDGFQGNQLKIHGVALTRSGKELMRVVSVEAEPKFSADLSSWFEAQKVRMVRVRASET